MLHVVQIGECLNMPGLVSYYVEEPSMIRLFRPVDSHYFCRPGMNITVIALIGDPNEVKTPRGDSCKTALPKHMY